MKHTDKHMWPTPTPTPTPTPKPNTNTNTNTNTNNGQNRNQNSNRGGLGRGGPTRGDRGDCHNGRGNTTIAKYTFEGKMKDGPISKFLFTKIRHRPTQFKKITNTLPVLCPDKNFRGLDEVHQPSWNQLHAELFQRQRVVYLSPCES